MCSRVRNDIINSLKMKDPYVSIGSFDRKNLFYGVKSFNRSQSSVNELVKEIAKYVASAGSTIIYCTTIKDVEQVYSFICLFFFLFFKKLLFIFFPVGIFYLSHVVIHLCSFFTREYIVICLSIWAKITLYVNHDLSSHFSW